MRKIGKIMVFLALVLLIAVASVGMANGATNKEAKNGILEDVVEENERETDSLTVITLIRDPQQIDGTAYAYVSYSPGSGNSDKAIEKENNPENIGFLILALLGMTVFISCLIHIKVKKKETKIGKRAGLFLGLVLILIVFVGLPMNASAQFAGGDGSVENPYQISTVGQLQDMDTDLTAHYILIDNIDATATSGWNWNVDHYEGFAPVGNSTSNYFTGSFDGDGHTISNLYINRTTQYTGLFGFVHGGTIKNVTLTNVDISGGSNTGGLVGRHRESSEMLNCSVTGTVSGLNEVGGLVGRNVINSTISDCSATCDVSGNNQVGGLVGRNVNNSTISGCSAACDVDGNWYVGGLVGVNINSATISNSNATGSVDGEWQIGGLVGRNNNASISGSSANCIVTSSPWEGTGGLVGYNENGSTISNSSATGTVNGTKQVGGLVGRNNNASISGSSAVCDVTSSLDHAGGLVGYNLYSGTISDSQATGNVNGTKQVGGLAGESWPNTNISNCSASGIVNGDYMVGGLVGWLDENSVISNSEATCDVDGGDRTGGLVGYSSYSQITDSSAAGIVVGGLQVGGLVGRNFTGTISGSSSSGSVDGNGYVGGLVGGLAWDSTISDSDSTCNTEGMWDVGGLVGGTWGNDTAPGNERNKILNCTATGNASGTGDGWIGGMIGEMYYTEASNCHASGSAQGHQQVGGLVGRFDDASRITDCYASGNVSASVYSSAIYPVARFGGLIGTMSSQSILEDSYATGNVTTEPDPNDPEFAILVGGLCGYTGWNLAEDGPYGEVTNCYATGNVIGGEYVGGLTGYIGRRTAITNCYATGSASGTWNVGGLAGDTTELSMISNSYAIGDVSGTRDLGGLTGRLENNSELNNCYSTSNVTATYLEFGGTEEPSNVGGLVGECSFEEDWGGNVISNCYSAGNVSVTYSVVLPLTVGGLVGAKDTETTVSSCYWDVETSGQSTSAGGTGKTTVEMKQQATFVGWDFVNIWRIHEDSTYPRFWYISPPIAEAGAAQTVIVGEIVNFDGSGSYDPDGTVVAYDWDFGDENTTTGVTTTHAYDTAGTYIVTLTVTDDDDATDSDTVTITVITPEDAAQDLITMIEEMGLPDGIENSFISKLQNVINSILNDRPSAAGQLGAFINEVNAQRGVTLTDAEADALIAFVQWILDNL